MSKERVFEMTENDIEKMLGDTDFSRFSKVKNRLFNQIMDMDMDSQMSVYDDKLLSIDELDSVVAAGSFVPAPNHKKFQ